MTTADVQTRLSMDAHAPAHARDFLRQASCAAHSAAVLDVSVLLVSELVTNAVRHATPPITVSLHCDESTGLEISVSDGSLRAPFLHHPNAQEATGQATRRGIALIETISDAWGVMPTGAGKVVWCRLHPTSSAR